MVDPTELTMQQVMKRYCRPRAVNFHPAIKTKHLIANLLSMTEPEPPKLLQLGANPALMGPMKATVRRLPILMVPPDRFQGNEHALGPSGSLPWDLQSEGLHLMIQTRTGCIFQLNVPPLHTVKLLKQEIGTAILESTSVFELYFREEALNEQDPLHEYGISSGCLLLISLQSPTLPDKTFDTAVERHCHNAYRHDSLLPPALLHDLLPLTRAGARAQFAKPLLPSGGVGSLW